MSNNEPMMVALCEVTDSHGPAGDGDNLVVCPWNILRVVILYLCERMRQARYQGAPNFARLYLSSMHRVEDTYSQLK